MRRGTLLHGLLSAYLWVIAWVPLGNWNRQRGGTYLIALLSGQGIDTGDVGMLVFISLPVALFWAAYQRDSFRIGVAALFVDRYLAHPADSILVGALRAGNRQAVAA